MPHKETEAMDVQQHSGMDRTHRNHLIQPESRVAEQDITQQPAKLPRANGIGYGGSNDSLTDIVITNENALLLPNHVPVIVHKLDKETPSPLNGLSSTDTVPNRSPPVCTPPTASAGQRAPDSAHIPKANGHNKPHKKRPPSTTKSQQSLKTSANQIQEVAGDDSENPDIDTKSSAYNRYTIRQKTAVLTVSWPVCSVSWCPCAQPWLSVWPVEWNVTLCAVVARRAETWRFAPGTPAPPCWTVPSWRTAANPPTAWRSVLSAALSASLLRQQISNGEDSSTLTETIWNVASHRCVAERFVVMEVACLIYSVG